MLKFSKRKNGCLTWTLGIVLFVMLAWGGDGIHIKQKAVQESKHPEVAQVVERYLRKVDSNALTDKGKIKNYKILYNQSEYDFNRGLCIHIIVNEDENLRVTFYVVKNDNIIGSHSLGEYIDRFVNESEAFIEKFGEVKKDEL